MEIIFIFLGIIVVSAIVWMLVKKSKDIKIECMPPGPPGLPVFGQGFHLSINSAHLQFTEWSKQYGDIFMFKIFGKKIVVLNNPDVIRKTFADNHLASQTSDRPESFLGQYVADYYKDVLFRRYDEVCEKLKTTTMKAIHSSGITSTVYASLQQEEIQEYILQITKSNGEDLDIVKPLEVSLCKLIGILFTGRRLDTEDAAFQAIFEFDKNGNEMILPSTHLTLKLVPFLRYLPGYYGNLYRRTLASKSRLRTRLLNTMKDQYDVEKRDCLLHALYSIQKEEKWLTDDLILGVIMDLINTSTLTSRGVLSGIFFLLVHFQNIQEKIREELDSAVGPDELPSVGDMSRMPFTHACILETLRFQSHLGITATHTNSSSDITIDGFLIPRGTSMPLNVKLELCCPNLHFVLQLYGNQWAVHHDESFWDEPWVFKPERFLKNGQLIPGDDDRRHRFYMPFGVGNRSCMGVQITYQRMFLFVTTLLQKHKILPPSSETLPSSDPRELTPGTVLQAPMFLCRVVAR